MHVLHSLIYRKTIILPYKELPSPYKGPIKFLEPYLKKQDIQNNNLLVDKFSIINKWTKNYNINSKVPYYYGQIHICRMFKSITSSVSNSKAFIVAHPILSFYHMYFATKIKFLETWLHVLLKENNDLLKNYLFSIISLFQGRQSSRERPC